MLFVFVDVEMLREAVAFVTAALEDQIASRREAQVVG